MADVRRNDVGRKSQQGVFGDCIGGHVEFLKSSRDPVQRSTARCRIITLPEQRAQRALRKKQTELRSELLNEGQGVEALPVRSPVIVAPTPNSLETSGSIHLRCAVPVAHFKVNAAEALITRAAREFVEQAAADALAMTAVKHCKEQQFGFIGDRPRQGKADR